MQITKYTILKQFRTNFCYTLWEIALISIVMSVPTLRESFGLVPYKSMTIFIVALSALVLPL
jgi:hypothetical protein